MALYEKSKAKSITANKDKLKQIVMITLHDMATIVGSTLGPGGRGVLIERDGLPPLISKDGYNVAKSLGLDNAEANTIVEAAKEICLNTAKQAGDGTTTAIVLADAIVKHGHEFMASNLKYNPQRLVNELQELYDDVLVPYLKRNAISVEGEEQLKHVAAISANGDYKIAEKVVEAVMKAGDDGTVLIEEGQGDVMRVETMDGYIVTSGLKDLGQIGTIFINDKGNQQVKMDNGVIFLYDGTMNDLKVPALIQQAIEGTSLLGSPIVVFAHGFSDIVLERFAKTAKGGVTVTPIKTPMSGLPNSRSLFLQDMAAYTGATVYDPGNLQPVEEDEEDVQFGTFREARVNLYETLISCDVDSDRINARVRELKCIGDMAFSDMDRMHVRAAIGKLTGGISTIWVGGASELEVREKKHRVEDAVEAVRAAIAEGIIPGGCNLHLKFAQLLEKELKNKPSAVILMKALQEPIKLLLNNCGEDDSAIIARLNEFTNKLGFEDKLNFEVFDANRHEFVNALDVGIIEPAKVCRVSLGNALSVASLLMTIGGIVCVPRNSELEAQLDMGKQAFKDMMAAGGVEG